LKLIPPAEIDVRFGTRGFDEASLDSRLVEFMKSECRSKDNIKINLEGAEPEISNLAQDRNQWMTVVNRAIKCGIPSTYTSEGLELRCL
jgi:hypothetical protein